MKSILRRRPSPALVIALIALFISLSGVAYGVATGSIDSREIKNNTIRSRDLRNNDIRTRDLRNNEIRGRDIRNSTVQGRDVALNTLTGDDINESRLGKVPSATSADTAASATSAQSAQNAATVGGMSVQKIFAKLPAGNSGQEVFRNAYFALVGSCQAGNAGLRIVAVAGAPATNASAHVINGATPSSTPVLESTNNLASGTGLDLTNAGNEGSATVAVSTTDGRVATVVVSALNSPAFQGQAVCAVRGTVTSG